MHIVYTLVQSRLFIFTLILALVAWTWGVPNMVQRAQAAGLKSVSDTISDSDLGVDAEHSITFTTPNGLQAGDAIRITFDPSGQAFDLTGLTSTDVSSSTTHTVWDSSGSCAAGVDFYVNAISTTSDYVEYVLCPGDTVASSTQINFLIGKEGTNDINNPTTAGSYVIRIDGGAGGWQDSGDTRVAIVDDVTVTASVETIFTFTITGVNASTTVNNETVQTSATTTATSVPFGVISPGTPKFLAQELRVDTNAANGFTVTVQADQTLTASNGADIDTFIDGNSTASTTAWQSPSNTFGNENTYGHWGLTTDDTDVGSSTLIFGNGSAAFYVGNFVNNPIPVFYHNQPVSYTSSPTSGQSYTRVGYKVEINTLQEAAPDYTATLTYIATPVF